MDIAILHPAGRTSVVQRRQMTTVLEPNVANIAIDGTFDDCQDLVKAMFADAPFRKELRLSAVNSINWARIAAQIPYYVAGALALGAPEREVAFSVPTGNFGNVLAAWAARRMGLPITRLVVASNRNDILARFLAENDMTVRDVEPSLSPSMDVQISSNFERLLFELLDRDPAQTTAAMAGFRATGRMAVPHAAWQRASTVMHGFRLDDPRHARRNHPAGPRLRLSRRPAPPPSASPPPGPPPTTPPASTSRSSPPPPPTPPSSRTRWNRRPAAARRCQITWPTYMNGPNASPPPPHAWTPSRPSCAPSRIGMLHEH